MKMAVESMEMAPGAIPHLGRVPEQRLLSPELRLQWWQRCGTFRGWMSIPLGFSRRREFIGGRAMSEGTQGPTPPGGVARGDPRHPMVLPAPGPPPSLLWTPSSCQEK
jgi:hypothetical protein